MRNLLLVFIGGGLGSLCRYLTSKWMTNLSGGSAFPLGTFTANVLGCLLIGLIMGFLTKYTHLPKSLGLLLATGFCGGFTTFSSFAFENFQLIKQDDYVTAFTYLGSSLLLGLAAVFIGLWLAKIIHLPFS